MRVFLIAAALALPAAAFAVGSGTNAPPTPTKTTKECKKGTVWDADLEKCVKPDSSFLDDDERYLAAREFAYAGQYLNALRVLDAMSDQADDRVLTYRGFVHRKMGERALGNAYYRQAIARNPDNLLARSYMGQGLVETGDLAAAEEQLQQILARGGAGSWPATALHEAIESGETYSY